MIIYLVRFEIYFDNLHYIYAAQAQSDQLISAQSRRLQTQNEIPKFSIRQTIPNLNNVKVSQAKLIFEEKINLSYIHIKIKVWRYPYLSQFFRK